MADKDDDKKTFNTTFKIQRNNIAIWGSFITTSLVVYYYLSSGDFSFLLTYASFMRCFGFMLLNFKMASTKTAKGLSIKTLQLYALTFSVRLVSILRHQGYLPFDKTGDWFYHVVELISLVAVMASIYGIVGPLISTYDEKYDRFGFFKVPNEYGALYLIIPCVVLAVFFHPTLNREWMSDVCWTLSMYLEAVAMLPQIYMFQKQAADVGGAVDALIGHTVFALGFSRIFELIFWFGSFKELADHYNNGSRLPGYIVLVSQFGHLLVMADFFYYYLMSLSRGTNMELPTSYNNFV